MDEQKEGDLSATANGEAAGNGALQVTFSGLPESPQSAQQEEEDVGVDVDNRASSDQKR